MDEIIEIKISKEFDELINYQKYMIGIISSAFAIPYNLFSDKKDSRNQLLLTEGNSKCQ